MYEIKSYKKYIFEILNKDFNKITYKELKKIL